MVKKTTLIFIGLFLSFIAHSQGVIKVRVLSVKALNNHDCDNILFNLTGDSDFAWEFTATDNTLSFTNNNSAGLGLLGFNYGYKNEDNGPYTLNAPSGNFEPNSGVFFNHDYICSNDVPTQINLDWEAYENDDATNYSLFGFNDGQTGLQSVSMAVPVAAGTLNYTYTASSTDNGCPQNYEINLQVERAPLTVTYFADNICDADLITLDNTYTKGWCTASLEPNEPAASDVQNSGSVWCKFVAPASGSVEITTDLSGTEIGTYFEIYHAADGDNCTTGLQPITATVIKDKYEYLSHVQFADGIDFLGVDPEAEVTLDACNPVPLFTYQKLIPGEVYYVQLANDDPSDRNYYKFRVNDLGSGGNGSPDVPCISPQVVISTTEISSELGSTPSTNLDFDCAYDGGNSYGETGMPHGGSSNPDDYHAYDYDHVGLNNTVMNESVWLHFVAPNSGRIVFETDYNSALFGESGALFAYDDRFTPGVPADYSCANLSFVDSDEGGVNGFLGSDPYATITARCLEPGYNYYGMIDPSDNLTPFNSQNIDAWVYDPSAVDPTLNAPGNDILCLTLLDTLYEVPVVLTGTSPNFQAVSGTNVLACREYLAGEPPIDPNQNNRADQTVWHYFTAPSTGAVEMSIRAYVGMDTVRYNVYELLNGVDCYGGLQPATFTDDGTRNTPMITPYSSGSVGYSGSQESICCMDPGKVYAIQIDGGSPGDEGQYIIEYIKEAESDAGDVFVEMANGDTIEVISSDTAFICYNDSVFPGIMVDGIGQSTQSIPSCIIPGYVVHQVVPVPNPIANTGFTFIDSVQSINGHFVNDGDGSGTFGNPIYNNLYYLSPAADIPAVWGDFSCYSSTAEDGVPVVFLEELLANISYNISNCEVTFSFTGGLNGFTGNDYDYTITDPFGTVSSTGSVSVSSPIIYNAVIAGIYTIDVTDGNCSASFNVDATGCNNPCVPSVNDVTLQICDGDSTLLGGAMQTSAGIFTDVFVSFLGCDSTVNTTLTVAPVSSVSVTLDLCPGGSIQVGSSTYTSQGDYIDTLSDINGCDSIVKSLIFMLPVLESSSQVAICAGGSYDFNGNSYDTEGNYVDTLTTSSGCDSIVKLSLFVTDAEITFKNETICSNSTYEFGGQVLSASGLYVDTLTTSSGCDSLIQLELVVEDCELEISNILTPNDDGENDTWKVSDISKIAGCDVTIYNRWGQPVYQTNDYQNDWSGTNNGDVLPDGVYFYSIICSDKELKGSINLLRFKK